jgi:hypothetical protein
MGTYSYKTAQSIKCKQSTAQRHNTWRVDTIALVWTAHNPLKIYIIHI